MPNKNLYLYFIITFLFYIIFQAIFYIYFKSVYDIPFYGSDTKRFIFGAEKIYNLDFNSLGKSRDYLTYVLLFYLTDYIFKVDHINIVYIQIFTGYIGALYLFLLSKKLHGDISALITFFLFLIYLDIHRWNFILYSDSIFVSLMIISLYYLTKLDNLKKFLIYLPIFIITIFSRPHGILLIFLIVLKICMLLDLKIKNIFMTFGIFIVIFMTVFFEKINNILINNNEWFKYFINAQYIAEYENDKFSLNISDKCLNNNFLRLIFCGLVSDPLNLIKVNLLKIFYYLINIRPYWDIKHIIINILFNLTIIISFIFYFIKNKFLKHDIIFISTIVLFILTILATVNDYDGRFFNPIFPFLCIYCGALFKNIFFKKHKLYL